MGTTRDGLSTTNGLSFAWIVAIEGFPYLLTSGDPAAAVTAFSGTDWTQALGGLFVDLDRAQAFDPWNPFPQGGRCTLRVTPTPDGGDVLGVQLHRGDAGAYTYLKEPIDCNDTTITVASTSEFPAAPGEIWIGNECIEYGAIGSGTTFTSCTRGKYTPFRADSSMGFGRPHRAGLASSLNVNLEPVVSQHRRMWAGAQVGVWIARDVRGVLDVKAQAQLVFAGTIAEHSDDTETGHAVIELVDLIEVGSRTLVRDRFRARIADGMWIEAGKRISFFDFNGSTVKNADDLVCTVGASGTNEFEEGFYTVTELASKINEWLQAEKAASRVYGDYSLVTPYLDPNVGYRTDMMWGMFGVGITTSTQVFWQLEMPYHIAVFFGIAENADNSGGFVVEWGEEDTGATYHFRFSDFPPLRWYIPAGNPIHDPRLRLMEQEGIAWNNLDWLPKHLPSPDHQHAPNGQNTILDGTESAADGDWGVFLLGGKPFVVGAVNGDELRKVTRFFNHENLSVPYEHGVAPPRIELEQVYVISGGFAEVMLRLFYSTGTAAFNDATYDEFPQTLSLGFSKDLLGTAFINSLAAAPFHDRKLTLIVDRPLKLIELVGADLILRAMHLVWTNGGLAFRVWDTPLAANAVASLTDANKARPARHRATLRTPTTITRRWLTPIVKIMFNREWTSGDYLDGPLILEDRSSIDDMGGDAPEKTIMARNMTKEDVQAMAGHFLALMPNVSRPAYLIRRTIAQTLFEQLVPGDTVLLTDGFARDPGTGLRGMTSVPGIVASISWSPGGPEATNPRETASQVGEVEVVCYPGGRFAPYCPAGLVDASVSSGGFTAGYNDSAKTLRLVAHEFSESADPADTSRFEAGDVIEIIERDPADPSSPITWTRDIASVSGNDIILELALSSPSFDTAKQYYVRSTNYSNAQQTQLDNVYQADDADARIENLANPFHYSAPAGGGAPFTAEDHTEKAELVPTASHGDGVARDVAFERALIRLLGGLMDHGTAYQSPVMWGGTSPISTVGDGYGGFRLVLCQERYFGRCTPNPLAARFVSMAPFFRSAAGDSVSVRITLSRHMPVGSSIDNVTFPAPYVQNTWTTSSTTWQTGAPFDFDLNVLGDDGIGVISVELTAQAQTRGVAKCRESERR